MHMQGVQKAKTRQGQHVLTVVTRKRCAATTYMRRLHHTMDGILGLLGRTYRRRPLVGLTIAAEKKGIRQVLRCLYEGIVVIFIAL
jgi:hypothetical protein